MRSREKSYWVRILYSKIIIIQSTTNSLFSSCTLQGQFFSIFLFVSLVSERTELKNVNVWNVLFSKCIEYYFLWADANESTYNVVWHHWCHPFQNHVNVYHIYTKHINNFASDCLHWFSSPFFLSIILSYIFMLVAVGFLFVIFVFVLHAFSGVALVSKTQYFMPRIKSIRIFNGFKSGELFIHTICSLTNNSFNSNSIQSHTEKTSNTIIMEHDHPWELNQTFNDGLIAILDTAYLCER